MPLPLFLSLHLLLPLPLCHQIYFGAGVFSSVYSAVILPNTISVGASGALMGIMGAWVVHLLTHWAQARGARGWPCGPGALSPRPALRRVSRAQDTGEPGEQRGMGNPAIQLILAIVNIGIILCVLLLGQQHLCSRGGRAREGPLTS